MGFLSILSKGAKPKPTLTLHANKPCSCGSESFSTLHPYWDVVICRGCGAVYAIGESIQNPIAVFQTDQD